MTQDEITPRMRQLEQVVRRYLNKQEDEPAVVTVMSTYRFIEAMRGVAMGKTGPAYAGAATESLVVMGLGMGVNPFVQICGGAFYHVVALSLIALENADAYAQDTNSLRSQNNFDAAQVSFVKSVACGQQLCDILFSAIVLWRKDAAYLRSISHRAREDFLSIQ
jgi:hypothetical protein